MLLSQITWKKRDMHKKADLYGLTDTRTVQSSQQLDTLLNEYQGIHPRTKKRFAGIIKEY
ncbi:Spo0E like sporulation regulatory protein [Alteribacillus persepolensis]|uniref:Spo0E like sporulation regulatory protein n=1 Tax=Alteribacillus persepolensis TaxID=568899 RepID=A0A1G7Z4I8_9BACI|nr:Spo0E like sporulation regulatory protein [Alteribacillus persepolensis]